MEVEINITGSSRTEMQLDGVVKMLLNIRRIYKANGNFFGGDGIRDFLKELGILVQDKKDGSTGYRKDSNVFSDLFTPTGEIR